MIVKPWELYEENYERVRCHTCCNAIAKVKLCRYREETRICHKCHLKVEFWYTHCELL